MGNVVLIQASPEVRSGEQLKQVGQWQDALVGAFDKGFPVTDVLFRPSSTERPSVAARSV